MNSYVSKIVNWVVNKLISSILEALGKYIPAVLDDWKRKKQREVAQEEAKVELEKELSKPDLTPEEKAKAYAKYQNSGN
jgi:hypothetical protein